MSGFLTLRWRHLRLRFSCRLGRPRSLGERIDRAAATMPLFTYTVFNMHRHEGHDYATIAKMLRIDVDEVERHIAAALLHLAVALDRDV
ncbi:sigma factor-like helix-turn-helix DNA-binding protein [Sphingomonas sp. LaA6.9]|uniref:sigma factor-like helix-turn-helix DNA-binding protein n=1 Tax=Sphingomonas sp. LaA6.9 TaxID=2919914 RepID=UPI001F4F23C8|nr:sigma factor-like helix-turn-helix DNA-binding protein [Sphingomonas sp. LaA6.9]MCJ8159716.1 hypothetical protein [Sphingomonas sp. LaA6.9]